MILVIVPNYSYNESADLLVSIFERAQKSSAIPRDREIIEFLAQKICKDLDIPKP